MQKVLIALPLVLASMVSAQSQQPLEPGAPPVEVPHPNPQPAPPAPDGVPPVEAPPIAPPPPGETPPVAAPPEPTPPVTAPPVDVPPAAVPPVTPVPQPGNVVTYVNNTLPPAPAAQQVYPPCSATVRDQCQQREGRQPAPRKGHAHHRH